MNPSNFRPNLFIDIGATHAFFTLRETYLHTIYRRGEGDFGNAVVNGVYQGSVEHEVRSFHHFNLSQDADEAVAKAKAHAERVGLPLTASAEDLRMEMREIHRAGAAEMERRQQERVAREQMWAAERAMEDEMVVAAARCGWYAMGRVLAVPFVEKEADYLTWMVSKMPEFEEGSLIRRVAEVVRDDWAHLLLPAPGTKHHPAAVGKRIDFEATVLRQFFFDGEWGRTYITTMVDADGCSLVVKSGAFAPDVGDVVRGKATIKAHDEYKGVPQTVLQRVKCDTGSATQPRAIRFN